jgi:ComF family protein
VLEAMVALVVPPRCLVCGAPVGPGRGLCGGCTAELPWLADTCERCALPPPCGPPCPAQRAAFARAWAPLAFEGPARSLVHALKFRGRTAAAPVMAAQIAANLPPQLIEAAHMLVPAPTDPRRRRSRGFDHARLLASALAERTRLPSLDALSHHGAAKQVGRSRRERRRGPQIAPTRRVSGTVVVVDDVHTTGATLDACARALAAAGASRVIAVTYARTLG